MSPHKLFGSGPARGARACRPVAEGLPVASRGGRRELHGPAALPVSLNGAMMNFG